MDWLISWLCLGVASMIVVSIDKKWILSRKRGEVPDLSSNSLATELAIYAAIGVVALPIHFYVSRRGARGLVLAIPLTACAMALAMVLRFATVLSLVAVLAR